jgi:hypothetical protein
MHVVTTTNFQREIRENAMKNFIIYMLISSFLVCPAYAGLYKWVDENGVTHFSNTAPPKSSDQVETVSEIQSVENQATDVSNDAPVTGEVNPAKVEFYKGYMEKWEKLLKQYRNELEDIKQESHIDQVEQKQKLEEKNEQIQLAERKMYMYKRQYEKALKGQ